MRDQDPGGGRQCPGASSLSWSVQPTVQHSQLSVIMDDTELQLSDTRLEPFNHHKQTGTRALCMDCTGWPASTMWRSWIPWERRAWWMNPRTSSTRPNPPEKGAAGFDKRATGTWPRRHEDGGWRRWPGDKPGEVDGRRDIPPVLSQDGATAGRWPGPWRRGVCNEILFSYPPQSPTNEKSPCVDGGSRSAGGGSPAWATLWKSQ